MSAPRTLLTGARVRVERPRALTHLEAREAIRERTHADADWHDDGERYERCEDLPPCHWVAMVEAAALRGAL